MFERFTDASRRVVVLAQEEARMLGHGHIGTEHLLLGLLNEQSGIPAKVLESAGVTIDAARVQVAEIAGPGSKPPRGHIPFTPRAKRVLELSLREALELRQSNIRPEHVLLGLIRERNGVGAQVIQRLGGPLPDLRQRVLDAAKDAPPDPVREEEHGPERSVWNWAPVRGHGPELQLTNESIFGFRHLLTSLDKRLSDIEQHLGIAAGERNRPGFRGLLLSVDRHLANIERHLGIPLQPHAPEDPDEPDEPDEPEAEAD